MKRSSSTLTGISKDRISDIACNFLKSFLIDFTIDQCHKHDIPLVKVRLGSLYNYQAQRFELNVGGRTTRDTGVNGGVRLVRRAE